MMERITLAKVDGIGPAIMDATLKIIKVVRAQRKCDELGLGKEISLLVGATWLICGLILTILEPKNVFFALFLGTGIFFSGYALHKTQKKL